jgi:predicted acylesterase/phospholipase RssA
MDIDDKNIGIALGGGGSLGAYEMGVWDALRELDITPSVISGTSIGALIGAFMAADKYDAADALWHDVSPEKVMRDGLDFEWGAFRKTFLKDRQRIMTFTKRYIKNRGADITPLIDSIKSSISISEIKQAIPRFGVVAVELPLLKQRNVELKTVPDEQVYDWLFASSAVWPLFPVRTIGKKTYIDGGYKDSLPIQFAFDMGAKRVIAVNLFYKIAWHPLLNKRSDVINIEPSWNLGVPFNFNQTTIDRNRKLGYNDAMKKLGSLVGYRYTFVHNDKIRNLEQKMLSLLETDFKSNQHAVNRILKRHTSGKLLPGHLFIRGLEVIAETLGIDPTPVYEIDQLAEHINTSLRSRFESKDVVAILKKVRSRKTLTKKEQRTAMDAIKYVLEKHFHTNDIFHWLSSQAKYVLTYVMLLLIHNSSFK